MSKKKDQKKAAPKASPKDEVKKAAASAQPQEPAGEVDDQIDDEDPDGLEAAAQEKKSNIKFRCPTCGSKYEEDSQLSFVDDTGKEHAYCPNCFQKWVHRFVPTLVPWTEA